MKTCPVCKQTYNDDEQNFCLNDGTTLVKVNDDPPPTVFMDQARKTNQNWSDANTNFQPPWQSTQNQPASNNQFGQNQPFGGQNSQQFGGQTQNQSFGIQGQAFAVQGQNQTLAIVSLALGILGIVLSVCCYGGIPFGLAALITGYIAMNNIKGDPMTYGGKNFAVAGMITGAVGFLITAGVFLMVIASGLIR